MIMSILRRLTNPSSVYLEAKGIVLPGSGRAAIKKGQTSGFLYPLPNSKRSASFPAPPVDVRQQWGVQAKEKQRYEEPGSWHRHVRGLVSMHGELLERIAIELNDRQWHQISTNNAVVYVRLKTFWNGSGILETQWGTKEVRGGGYLIALKKRDLRSIPKVAWHLAAAIAQQGSEVFPTRD